jgi:hypothetical protein
LTRIDAHALQAAGLQQLEERNPVDAGRFHGYGGHATVQKPISQGIEGGGAGAEPAHRGGEWSGGMAPQCSAAPISIPAAWALSSWREEDGRSTEGCGTVGAGGHGSGNASFEGVI